MPIITAEMLQICFDMMHCNLYPQEDLKILLNLSPKLKQGLEIRSQLKKYLPQSKEYKEKHIREKHQCHREIVDKALCFLQMGFKIFNYNH